MYSNVDIKKYDEGEASNIAAHNLRQIPSANVNPKKSHLNQFYVGGPTTNYHQVVGEKLTKVKKIRKNAVKTVNLVFSASPELFKDRSKALQWEKDTWEFIKKEFGEENIVYCVCHKDEKTPHFQVSLTPIINGKLNASHWFDGRKKVDEFITRYNDAVKHLGLKKSKGKEKSTPQTTQEFYNKVNQASNFDKRLDKEIIKIEGKIDQQTNILGYIKASTVKDILSPFAKLLKQLYAKSLQDAKKVKEAKETAQKLADLQLKVETLGIDPNMSFIKANELKSIIELGTATAEARRIANSNPPQDVKNSTDYSTSHEVDFKKKFKPK